MTKDPHRVREYGALKFTKLKNGNLKITLTREGRQYIKDERENGRTDDQIFGDMLSNYGTSGPCQNGWEGVNAEDIGAITGATIISEECDRDDHGDLVKCGRVYSNIDYYQVESDVERLLRKKELIWKGVA